MTGVVLALAGLTCGDGGPGRGAATAPMCQAPARQVYPADTPRLRTGSPSSFPWPDPIYRPVGRLRPIPLKKLLDP
jgi:hypothetical protein